MFSVNRCHLVSFFFILFVLVYYVSVGSGRQEESNYPNDDLNAISEYLNDRDDHLVWFVQISDLHISIYHNEGIVNDLEYFINNVLSFIKPKVVIVTGDLTDGKYLNGRSTGQLEEEWKLYASTLNKTGILGKTAWLDVRGNHDNFDVLGKNSVTNLYNKYGVMRDQEPNYIYKLNMSNEDQYSFIGIDACANPGPRGPFNFFGNLKQNDVKEIKRLDESSRSSNGTIWFGHFPTSTIHSPVDIHSLMSNGVAYLSGHLHTFGGLLPNMYGRQSNGMLELELSDWKFSRKFRIMSFDGGIFSFRDFKLSSPTSRRSSTPNELLVLITNPKSLLSKTTNNREPLDRILHSSHIRILAFSKYNILSVKVFIDDVYLGQATAVNSSLSPLYVLKWNSDQYRTGVHRIKVIVEDANKNLEVVSHDFALDDSLHLFTGLANFILTFDQTVVTTFYFWSAFSFNLGILIFFRFVRRRFTVNFISCNPFRTFTLRYLRRFSLLSSIDYVYWSLIGLLFYVPIGPWFLAQIFSDEYGVIFKWGILVNGHYIQPDIQNFFGLMHMISFQFYLMYHLAYQIENRFVHLYFSTNDALSSSPSPSKCSFSPLSIIKTILLWIFQNVTFLLLLASAFWNLKDMYLCFGLVSVLICPLKLWMPLIAIYLRYKCIHLNAADFDRFIDTSRLRKSTSTVTTTEQEQPLEETKRLLADNADSSSSKDS